MLFFFYKFRQNTTSIISIINTGDTMDNINYFNKFTHELKNPLTVCNGYLEMILKCSEEDKLTYIEIVRDEIKRSLNIIDEYSNNKLFSIEKKEFNITNLFEDIKSNLDDLYKENNTEIILISKSNLMYYGDYNKLKQVFINLIKNSYESKTNNKLIIVINIEEEKDKLKISIIDNGIGIRNINDIYKDYYTTKLNGNGLGIPYAKEIIELHKGSINYYSEENIGTRVEVILPK